MLITTTILLAILIMLAITLSTYVIQIYDDVKSKSFNKYTMLSIVGVIFNVLFIFLAINSVNSLNKELNVVVAFYAINFIIALSFSTIANNSFNLISAFKLLYNIFSSDDLNEFLYKNNYLHKLQFETPIDDIRIKDKNALKILSSINNDLIPKYNKCKEYIDKLNDDNNKNSAIRDLAFIKDKILNKCNEIASIINENEEDATNREYQKFHKLIREKDD